MYFFVTIVVADGFTTGEGLGVYGRGVQVRVGTGFETGFGTGFGEVLLPFCLAVMINFPVFGSV